MEASPIYISRFFHHATTSPLPYFPIAVGIVQNEKNHRIHGNRYKAHIYNLHVVTKGRGWVHSTKGRIPIEPYYGFVYSEHQVQRYEADPDDPWEVMWLYFKGEGIEAIIREHILGSDPWLLTAECGRLILPLIEQLWALAQDTYVSDIPRISALLYQILQEINILTGQSGKTPTKLEHKLRQTADYIRANCSKQLTLQHLADYCALSSAYFSRTFHTLYGMPPLEYIALQRIELAKQLLMITDMPVKQIALEVGYFQASYFIERFRRITDMTPSEYRSGVYDKNAPEPADD
ncbi:helix-turn-helix transcriptional regulator [Paenibacillus roseipurpureus]|uniref:AraC family transcriptional regulator n=1 Tax=Paenibacillus roseopurpureus TaxID=2918901 RepID=A0AA96LYY6_9BACL|nr:AraC family transcriptional regulator [Paenibacillus sp. MBLB1832]WNR47095.1 AraC family transcriptional regulator [Paenibacillus sp. MBLB1832]